MLHKRKDSLSPSADVFGSTFKRARVDESALSYTQQCSHCGSVAHNWVQCSVQCTHCAGAHQGRRCTLLPIDWYTPGGFQIPQPAQIHKRSTLFAILAPTSEATQADKNLFDNYKTTSIGEQAKLQAGKSTQMNAERAAMIALAPTMDPESRESALPERREPKVTGSNTVPLGSLKPIGTSWPLWVLKNSSQPEPIALIKPEKLEMTRDCGHEKKIWSELEPHVKTAVETTAVFAKPCNGQGDRAKVDQRIQDALELLRPMILGGQCSCPGSR